MTGDPDRKIDDLEKELARIQAEETTPRQIEANLARQSLGATLATAAVISASVLGVLNGLSAGLDASVERMADDLTGKRK